MSAYESMIVSPDDPGEAWTEGARNPGVGREPSQESLLRTLYGMCLRGTLMDYSSGEPVVVTPELFCRKYPDFSQPTK